MLPSLRRVYITFNFPEEPTRKDEIKRLRAELERARFKNMDLELDIETKSTNIGIFENHKAFVLVDRVKIAAAKELTESLELAKAKAEMAKLQKKFKKIVSKCRVLEDRKYAFVWLAHISQKTDN